MRFHKGSVRKTLMSLFPGDISNSIFLFVVDSKLDIDWKQEWFRVREHSRGWWKDKKNQRKFLDEFAEICKIKKPSEWGKITIVRLREYGGRTLLNHYGSSLFSVLTKVYPGRFLNEFSFSRNFMETRMVRTYSKI